MPAFEIRDNGFFLDGQPFQREFVAVCSEYGAVRMLRNQRYKLVKNYINGGDLFYDLQADPGETVNRIRDPICRQIREEMALQMDTAFAQYASPQKDGRFQFPKGMGQIRKCTPETGTQAYKQAFEMYYKQSPQ